MIDFIPTDGQLGQNTPATEGTVQQGFSTSEKILLVSVIISAVGLTVNLLHVAGYIRPPGDKTNDL